MEYTRGSEWRRWDFHLHTPDTKKNDQFQANGKGKWELFYENIANYIGDKTNPQKTIAAVGITDYFSVENYRKVKSDGILARHIDFIFPNIELRCLPLKDGVKMNVHLLINPSFIDKVDTIILSNLKYCSMDTEYCARKDDLIRFGKDLDASLDDEMAYKKGVENFNINFDDLIKILKNHPECKDNVLILMPNRSTDGASAVGNPTSPSVDLCDLCEYRRELYRTSDIILSANPSDINFFLGKRDKKPEKIMPCVWGCDAHTNEAIFEPLNSEKQPTKRYCWIKADPTWEGLKQVLFEPEERVRIQELCPADRIDNYRIIDQIVIEDDTVPHRFSNDAIPINENLTCIIGLKSTGKSILLQNIAQAIDPTEVTTRFNTVYAGKRIPFEFPIKVYWKDGTVSSKDSKDDKKIVYIAQSYLNKLMDDCAEKTEIDSIIEGIITQNEDFCILKKSFDAELIDIQKQIESKILDLIYKQRELIGQVAVIKDIGNRESIEKNIELLREKKESIAKSLNLSAEDIAKYDNAINKKQELEENLIVLQTDRNTIENSQFSVYVCGETKIVDAEITNMYNNALSLIESEASKRWNEKKQSIVKKIDEKLSTINNELKSTIDVIEALKPMMDSNEEIKRIENNLRAEETNLRKINAEFETLTNIQKSINSIIENILSLSTSRENKYDLFAEQFKTIHFKDTNENFKIIAIKRRRRVYFRDTITKIFTQNALKTIHNGVFRNFDDPSFILENEYDEACKKDYINAILENDTQKVLLSKYEKDRALQELFGDFDNIIYTVEMDGDLIESMSPGKKALVLLKLLISHDESKCPILLDQPEDDLDNLSIVSDLVAFIKERKRDRQIVLVTHNANLVLGCDAEEVIVANQQIDNNSLTHNKSFRFEYRSGSIENITTTDSDTFLGSRDIQQHICNILEGGKEAFIARKNKYTNL
mgnify:FL=1